MKNSKRFLFCSPLCVVFVVFQWRVFAQEGTILRRNVFSSITAPSVYTERQGLGKTATAHG